MRITGTQFVGALALSAFSFLFGFAASRYLIDLTLRQAEAVLLKSAQEYDREQVILMQQFRADYQALESKLNAIPSGKGKAH